MLNQVINYFDFLNLEMSGAWIQANWGSLLIGLFVVGAWILFHVIFYILYQTHQELLKLKKKPKIAHQLEELQKVVAFQEDQLMRLYDKIASIQTDLREWVKEDLKRPTSQGLGTNQASTSIEQHYVSLAELNLKKKIESLRAN